MSISTTRKVSTSTQTNKKISHVKSEGQGGSVEQVDTSNKTLVKDDDNHSGNNNQQQQNQEPEEETVFTTNNVYVPNLLDLQEDITTNKNTSRQNNVNIYQKNTEASLEEESEEGELI